MKAITREFKSVEKNPSRITATCLICHLPGSFSKDAIWSMLFTFWYLSSKTDFACAVFSQVLVKITFYPSSVPVNTSSILSSYPVLRTFLLSLSVNHTTIFIRHCPVAWGPTSIVHRLLTLALFSIRDRAKQILVLSNDLDIDLSTALECWLLLLVIPLFTN